LRPFMPYLKNEAVTEICINKPEELFIEANGKFIRREIKELEFNYLESLAALVAEFNDKKFPDTMISGSLPKGERIQFVMPPACEKGKIVLSIRKHKKISLTLDDYENAGSFDGLSKATKQQSHNQKLKELYASGKILEFIKLAIKSKKNIVICGGTGTGKTTFLNACLKHISLHERLITVEDAREVSMPHLNTAHLLFNEENIPMNSLNIFKACLRLRPDRIFLSEIRGAEVWPFLRAANSGHPGSLTTVHADSVKGAFTQMVFMMQQAGSTSTEEQIRNYLKSILDVVVQLKRDTNPGKFVRVDEVWFGGFAD